MQKTNFIASKPNKGTSNKPQIENETHSKDLFHQIKDKAQHTKQILKKFFTPNFMLSEVQRSAINNKKFNAKAVGNPPHLQIFANNNVNNFFSFLTSFKS